MTRGRCTAAVAVCAAVLAGCGTGVQRSTVVPQAATAPAVACGTVATPPATYAHVIWIFDENHSYDEIIGSPDAPGINALATECALAADFTGETHPSAPNYIAATSGAPHAGQDDCLPSACPDPDPSLFEQAGSWRSYAEGASGNCDGRNDGDAYDPNHVPAVYYTRLRAACAQDAVPLGTLQAGRLVDDLAHDTLPRFAFIAPNLNDDMHNGSIAQGDAYLAELMQLVLTSRAYRSGSTAVFFTFDEGETTDRIVLVAVAPSVRPGTVVGAPLNHYALLRTTEEMLGLPTFLQNADGAPSMRPLAHL